MKKALTHNSARRRPTLTFRVRVIGVLTLLVGVGLFASRPAHTAGGPIAVSVANTPLAVTTSPEQPVEVIVNVNSTTSPAEGIVYTVPAHKSLVVESMTLLAGGGHPGSYTGVVFNEDSTGVAISYATLTAPASTNSDTAATTQPMHFTVAPGGRVAVDVYLRDPSGLYALVSLSGHLVDAP